MPRKPAHLEFVGGKGLRQRIWDRIREIPALRPFSLLDILYGTEIHSESTAREYITGLFCAGYLDLRRAAVTTGAASRRTPALYTLARDAGAEAPRVRKDGAPVTQGLAQEQMWRTLRMTGGDTNARELAAHASTPAIPVAEAAAGDYLRNLHHAGYLICTAAARTTMKNGGKSPARYRLKPAGDGKGNTGPRAPMVCRTHVLYDPNTDATVPMERVTEELFIYGK